MAAAMNAGDAYKSADSGGFGALLDRSMDAVQGHRVLGYHTMERSLPVGTQLTVVGEVVNTSPPVSCLLQTPQCK